MITLEIRKRLKESLTYTLVFWLGYLVACNGGTMIHSTSGTPNNPTGTVGRMLSSSDHRGAAILSANSGNQPLIASGLFGGQSLPLATISNPSQLAQTYDSHCDQFKSTSGTITSLHQAYGNSGLATIPPLGGFGFCNSTVITSVGGDENGHPTGFPVILAGTVNDLVVYGTLVSGNFFRCLDTTNTSSLGDNTFVRGITIWPTMLSFLGVGRLNLALHVPSQFLREMILSTLRFNG